MNQNNCSFIQKASDPKLYEAREELAAIRQDLHRHPEIGLTNSRTAAQIIKKLTEYGVDQIEANIAGSGVAAVIKGRMPGSDAAVGLRADTDALPLKELSTHDHVSDHEGFMHACGHDGHTASLLGAAKYLCESRDFPGKVVLIFQPGEEGYSGARHMIEAGVLDRFPLNEIYAFHNASSLEPGKVALNRGVMQAAADAFTITVNGKGGHASRPHLNHDPVIAAAHVLLALQTIVSREIDPAQTAVVSCCSLQAGDPRAQSVCPQSCQIVGTARTFSPSVRDLVEKRIGEISSAVAAGLGCTAETVYSRFYPPVINTPELADAVADICASRIGEENVDRRCPAVPGGEDFSFFLEKVPGVYFRIGNGGVAAHNPYFDFNDEILPLASTLMAHIAIGRLRGLSSGSYKDSGNAHAEC